MTHEGVAACWKGLRAPVFHVDLCKGVDCLKTGSLKRWFGCADGVLGVNTGALPVLVGVIASQSCKHIIALSHRLSFSPYINHV